MTNTVRLNSFFSKQITDNNGKTCSDINAGLVNLFGFLNESTINLETSQRYLVSEYEDGYPDLVAKNSNFGSEDYWWWLLILNRLEDPLTEIRYNWVYGIKSAEQVNSLIESSNTNNDNSSDSRLGTVVELN